MLSKIKLLLVTCFAILSFLAKAQPVRVILDTDMGPDYDDVGAITLLHDFADSGKVKILATMASTKYEHVAAVLNVLNTYFKRPGIPIGVPKGSALELRDWQHWTDTLVAKYPHIIKQNSEAADAVALYRKILAQQPDTSVTIITVGFLTNISNLLQSIPDQYSSLTGKDLISKKVKKMVCMAGRFPAGKEFNIEKDAAASKYVFEHWERPVFLSGFEIGRKIKTGLPLIENKNIVNSPVQDVFRICIPLATEDSAGRMSWDETAVLIAVAGVEPYYKLQPGKILVAEDGSNTWNNNAKGHFYLIEDKDPLYVQKIINNMLMHQPE